MTHGETSWILGVSSSVHQKFTKWKKLIMDCQIEYWSHRVEDARVIPYNQTNKKAIEQEEKDAESLTTHIQSMSISFPKQNANSAMPKQ
jgi:hypothetical protein